MLLEINKDIIELACKDNNDAKKCIKFLQRMAECVIKGTHIVYVPCLNTSYKKKLEAVLSKKEIAQLEYSSNKQLVKTESIIKYICFRVIFFCKNRPEGMPEVIMPINILANDNLECCNEVRLLTENLSDADFYKYVCYYYQRLVHMERVNCKSYAILGGGCTICNVYKREMALGQSLCLAIVDSDKISPQGNLGETAIKLLKEDKKCSKYTPYYGRCYVLKDVMEIENLIPHLLISKYKTKNGWACYINSNIPYFDIKEGLKVVSLYGSKDADYWKKIVDDNTLFRERDLMVKKYKNKSTFENHIKEVVKPVLLTEFGCQVLNKLMEKNYNDYEGFVPNKYELGKVTISDLQPYQETVWKELGQLLFSWTCSMEFEGNA